MGEPIIGANVVVKGTTNGTITDIDGNFSLEVPDNAILVVSYIGYTDRTVEVGNSSKVMVSLSEDTQKLDEVVVVGYGTQKKVNLTGAISSLDAETLRVAMDALESLRTQGRKIGVISHVQEMTERIPVQIRVNPGGKRTDVIWKSYSFTSHCGGSVGRCICFWESLSAWGIPQV